MLKSTARTIRELFDGQRVLALAVVAEGVPYAGLLPFVAGALGIALLDGEPRQFSARALVAYGAVILSFVGAVHWGLLLQSTAARAM